MDSALRNRGRLLLNPALPLAGGLAGLGRGAGNCPTELLLGFLRNPKFKQRPIIEAVEKWTLPLRETIDWGYSIPYMISGVYNEHPRIAIEFRESRDKDKFVKFFDMITTPEPEEPEK